MILSVANSIAIPRWLARLCLQAVLQKGLGHRYVRRVATGDEKHPYRYYYNLTGRSESFDKQQIAPGAKFKVAGGHLHVESVKGGVAQVVHDESGEKHAIRVEHLADLLEAHHGEEIEKKAVRREGNEFRRRTKTAALKRERSVRLPRSSRGVVKDIEHALNHDFGAVDMHDQRVLDTLAGYLPKLTLNRLKKEGSFTSAVAALVDKAGRRYSIRTWGDLLEAPVAGSTDTVFDVLRQVGHEVDDKKLKRAAPPTGAIDELARRDEEEHHRSQHENEHLDEHAEEGDDTFDISDFAASITAREVWDLQKSLTPQKNGKSAQVSTQASARLEKGIEMPTNIVKNKRDEAKWKRAKEIARKQKPDNLYALATSIYEKMSKGVSEADLEKAFSEVPDLVKSEMLYGGSSALPYWMQRYDGTPFLDRALEIEEESCESIAGINARMRDLRMRGSYNNPDAAAEMASLELELCAARNDYEAAKDDLAVQYVKALRAAKKQPVITLSKATAAGAEIAKAIEDPLEAWLAKAEGGIPGSGLTSVHSGLEPEDGDDIDGKGADHGAPPPSKGGTTAELPPAAVTEPGPDGEQPGEDLPNPGGTLEVRTQLVHYKRDDTLAKAIVQERRERKTEEAATRDRLRAQHAATTDYGGFVEHYRFSPNR